MAKAQQGKTEGLPQPDAELYRRLFQQNPDGQAVLADLACRFHDRPSVVPGDPEHMTFVREGERNVVLFIIGQCYKASAIKKAGKE